MSGDGFAVGSRGYDDEDRLVNWQRSDTNLDQSWNLLLVGNWNSITENASQANRTHGPTHELLTVASQSVTHDAKGNMTLILAVLRPGSDPLKMKWDFENKLIAADTDDDSIGDIFYKFDALGRRVGRDDGTANVVYFQDGQQTIADYPAGTAASSPTYTYVYASYIDEPVMRGGSGGLRYYHRNQQYSITALTDGGGAIIERYAYTAYGQVTFADASGTEQASSGSNNRYTYTGREWDSGLNLYHYRARMYDAVSGRFVSRDPLGYVDGSGLYSFLEHGVVHLVDPTGMCVERRTKEECCDAAFKAANRPTLLGGAICCDGRKLACVFLGEQMEHDLIKNPVAKQLIQICVRRHEERHLQDMDCPAKIPHLGPGRKPEISRELSECNARIVSHNCLKRMLIRCEHVRFRNVCDSSEIRAVLARNRELLIENCALARVPIDLNTL